MIFSQLIDHSTCFGSSIAEAGWTEHDLAAVVTKRAWDGGRDGTVITGLTDPSHIPLSRIVRRRGKIPDQRPVDFTPRSLKRKLLLQRRTRAPGWKLGSWQRGSAGATSDRYERWWAVIRRRSTGVALAQVTAR